MVVRSRSCISFSFGVLGLGFGGIRRLIVRQRCCIAVSAGVAWRRGRCRERGLRRAAAVAGHRDRDRRCRLVVRPGRCDAQASEAVAACADGRETWRMAATPPRPARAGPRAAGEPPRAKRAALRAPAPAKRTKRRATSNSWSSGLIPSSSSPKRFPAAAASLLPIAPPPRARSGFPRIADHRQRALRRLPEQPAQVRRTSASRRAPPAARAIKARGNCPARSRR